ncbi:hypothetical protein [Nonomuraea basaltis]|uniref:hypothetical protein n=1 Tax=Nonomuraea basaltis TaxID=2495887 RepID=UPI00110C55D9|nr:hypothetical protein [Nonomuraea basaltis]TMR92313.1 hypothetical protein EJK15_45335 [Nonomuraea basaltis]
MSRASLRSRSPSGVSRIPFSSGVASAVPRLSTPRPDACGGEVKAGRRTSDVQLFGEGEEDLDVGEDVFACPGERSDQLALGGFSAGAS